MKYSTTTTAMKMPHCLKASLPSVAARRTRARCQGAVACMTPRRACTLHDRGAGPHRSTRECIVDVVWQQNHHILAATRLGHFFSCDATLPPLHQTALFGTSRGRGALTHEEDVEDDAAGWDPRHQRHAEAPGLVRLRVGKGILRGDQGRDQGWLGRRKASQQPPHGTRSVRQGCRCRCQHGVKKTYATGRCVAGEMAKLLVKH